MIGIGTTPRPSATPPFNVSSPAIGAQSLEALSSTASSKSPLSLSNSSPAMPVLAAMVLAQSVMQSAPWEFASI